MARGRSSARGRALVRRMRVAALETSGRRVRRRRGARGAHLARSDAALLRATTASASSSTSHTLDGDSAQRRRAAPLRTGDLASASTCGRSSPSLDGADARAHRRAGLHHRAASARPSSPTASRSAEPVVLPGTGHFVFVEAPEAFRGRRARVPRRRSARLIEQAVAAIRDGRPVVLPTDTVYGLCADPYREAAGARALPAEAAAGRAADRAAREGRRHAARARARSCAAGPRRWRALLPGPYTLVLPNPDRRYRWLTGSAPETIGVRVPELDRPGRARCSSASARSWRRARTSTAGPTRGRLEDVPGGDPRRRGRGRRRRRASRARRRP